MVSSRASFRVLCAMMVFGLWFAVVRADAADQTAADVALLLRSPDVTFGGSYTFPATPSVLEKLMASPLLLAKLWEAYNFSPPYKSRMQGTAIHIDDPTGIEGDIVLTEHTANRYVYLGTGNLNHRLVPAFRGKMAMVITMNPKAAATDVKLDLYIRANSRAVGLLAWGFFPLVRSRVENRVSLNVLDLTTIFKNISASLPQTAARLPNKEDAAALTALFSPPLPKPAAKRID
jgi:hypothetical protein